MYVNLTLRVYKWNQMVTFVHSQSYRPIGVHLVPISFHLAETPWNSLKDPSGSPDPTMRTYDLPYPGLADQSWSHSLSLLSWVQW